MKTPNEQDNQLRQLHCNLLKELGRQDHSLALLSLMPEAAEEIWRNLKRAHERENLTVTFPGRQVAFESVRLTAPVQRQPVSAQLSDVAELLQECSGAGPGLLRCLAPQLTPEKLDEIARWRLEKNIEFHSTDADVAALQFNLGMCYARGFNVPQDSQKAVLWYREAAERSCPPAWFALEWCFCQGDGVPHPEECEPELGGYEREDEDDAPEQAAADSPLIADVGARTSIRQWWRGEVRFASRGHRSGSGGNLPGRTASFGADAVEPCGDRMDHHSPEALNNLAGCYALGRGVTPDYAEAVRLCRKAAEQGLAEAVCNLGLCYANGHGVEQSYAEAYRLLRKAADQGLDYAEYLLRECLKMRSSAAQKAALAQLKADSNADDELDELVAQLDGVDTASDGIPEPGEDQMDLVDQMKHYADTFLSGQLHDDRNWAW